MLTNAELEEHPDNIEGLEGLDPTWDIDYDDLEFGDELARGNFGAVSVAEYLGTDVAVKRLFDLDDDMKIYLQRELNVLKQIRHPNIVQFLGLSKNHEGLYLITEFVERGDLCRLLYDHSVKALDSWALRLKILVQSAQGLAYLHAKNLMHRDIKAANFLVGENWHIKLCDFGFSRSINATKETAMAAGSVMTLCGSDFWMAPEVMMGFDYDQAADVFSFSVYMQEAIQREEPKERSPATGFRFDSDQFKSVCSPSCPAELRQLMLDSAQYESKRRPTVKRVLQRLQLLSKTYVEPVVAALHTNSANKGKNSSGNDDEDDEASASSSSDSDSELGKKGVSTSTTPTTTKKHRHKKSKSKEPKSPKSPRNKETKSPRTRLTKSKKNRRRHRSDKKDEKKDEPSKREQRKERRQSRDRVK